MNVAVIGTGYVGLVVGACLAETGHNVLCADVVAEKIARLRRGELPVFEPGLQPLVTENLAAGRLSFTTDIAEAVRASDIIFIAVGTPPGEDGSADLQYVLKAAEAVGKAMDGERIVITKSTVPVGTATRVRDAIQQHSAHVVHVCSNPEFLKEGAAVEDFMKPDRVVLGVDDPGAAQVLRALYEPFVRTGHQILLMDVTSAEITKYAANAMLATRISFMNMIARLCDAAGADVDQVRLGVGSDSRIGPSFLFPGVGYGGSCFPKDVRALGRTIAGFGLDGSILEAVETVNETQKRSLLDLVVTRFGKDLSGRTFAVWGLAFKPNTDDVREAPSLVTIEGLLARGARVVAHDPVAVPQARRSLGRSRRVPRQELRRARGGGCTRDPHRVAPVSEPGLRSYAGAAAPARHLRRAQPLQAGSGRAGRLRVLLDRSSIANGRETSAVRVVITGAAGFLGSHLSDRFLADGHEVVGMDNLITGTLGNIAHLMECPRFEFVHLDVTNAVRVDGAVDGVLHLASPASPVDYLELPIPTLKVGSHGTHKTLGLARAKGARYLLASTSEVYGDPLVHPQAETYWGNVNPIGPRGVYDEAKRFAEALTMAYHRYHGLDTRIVRIFNTFGTRMRPGDGRVVSNFIVQALCGEPITIYGDGSQTRSFCYVDDEIEGIYRLFNSDRVEPTNIGNPDECTIQDLAEMVLEETNSESKISHRPLPTDDPRVRRPDIVVARAALDGSPKCSLREGLRRTIPYFRRLVEECDAGARAL